MSFRNASGDATVCIILPTHRGKSDWGVLSRQAAVWREGGTAYGGVEECLYTKQRKWETVVYNGTQALTWPIDKDREDVCVCVLRLDYENESLVWAMLSSTASGWSKIALQTENKGRKHILSNTPKLASVYPSLPVLCR